MEADDDRDKLQAEPTTARWQVEIGRLLDGRRALEVLSMGSAYAYISALIATSQDARLSETTFRTALDSFVGHRRLGDLDSYSEVNCFLDLIGAFVPPTGFPRLVELLESPASYDFSPNASDWYPNLGVDLILKAFAGLEEYFPLPPVDLERKLAFDRYVSVLQQYHGNHEHSAYAIFRLIELGVWSPEDPAFRQVLGGTSALLVDLIEYALYNPERSIASAVLAALFAESLAKGQDWLREFYQALAAHGCALTFSPSGTPGSKMGSTEQSVIVTSEGDVIELLLPWDWEGLVPSYVRERHSVLFLHRAFEKFHSIEPGEVIEH